MFKIEYEENGRIQHPIFSNDIRDVGQILINIANDEQAENEAMQWCGSANFGDRFRNDEYRFRITCVYDEKHTLRPGTSEFKPNRSNNPFKDEVKMQKIADVISKRTGYANKFIGCNGDSLEWDFNYGTSYMTNNGGKGIYFALVNDDGKELETILDTDAHRFCERVVEAFKNHTKAAGKVDNTSSINKTVRFSKSVPNKEIIEALKNTNSEWHGRIYNDGCWWVDLERHPYGHIRFCVGIEDSRDGNSRASIVSLRKISDTELGYNTDGIKIKKAVWDKIQSTAKALIRHNLLNIC